MSRELPLADAQRRLGKLGRPRKIEPGPGPSGHITGTPAAGARLSGGAQRGALALSAIAPRLLDVRRAAVYLGVSAWTIRDLLAAGRLPRVRLSLDGGRECRRLLFDRSDLDRLIDVSKEAT